MNTKISLKEYYELKKMVERIRKLVEELEINESSLPCAPADYTKIYDQQFVKVNFKSDSMQ